MVTTGTTANAASGETETSNNHSGLAFAYNATGAAITVDGTLDESTWNLENTITTLSSGVNDNQVSFDTKWDNNNLYVAVKVLDANLVNDSGLNTYNDDAIEIFIDGLNNRSKTYQADDNQIFIGYGDPTFETYHNSDGIHSATHSIEGGYTVELMVSWSNIGITPKEGMKIGFDIGNDDDDGLNGDQDREGVLMWQGDDNNWQDTTNFGEVFLTGNKKPAVASASEINVDGNLDEDVWTLENVVDKIANGESSNNLVKFSTACDDTYLYVAASVYDDQLCTDSEDQFWNDDAIEIFIDGDNVKGTIYDSNDRQFVFRYDDENVYGSVNKYGVRHAFQTIEGGYILEAAIPWINLGIDPTDGAVIGLDIANDDDDNGGNRESAVVWHGTGNNYADPSNFGFLLLQNESLVVQSYIGDKEAFSDITDSLDKVFSKTASVVAQNGTFMNSGSDEECSITYKTTSGDILSFEMDLLTDRTTPNPIKVFASGDGEVYTEVTPCIVLGTESTENYYLDKYYKKVMADGIKYIKFQIMTGEANFAAAKIDTVNFNFKAVKTRQKIDNTEDFSKLYFHTDKVSVQNWGYDDSNKFVNADSDEPCFITYKSPSGDISGFEIDGFINRWAVSQLPNGEAFEFYASSDNVSYEKVSATVQFDPNAEATNNFYNDKYINQSLPEGTKYLKIMIMSNVAQAWGVQIGTVTIDYKVLKAVFVDQTEDFSRVYLHTENVAVQESGYDSSNNFVKMVSEDPSHIIYKSLYGDILSFDIDAFIKENASRDGAALEFYVSKDNVTYQKINPEIALDSNAMATNGFFSDKYSIKQLPLDVKYLKLVFASREGDAGVGTVKFEYVIPEALFIDNTDTFSNLYKYSGNLSIQGWAYDSTSKYVYGGGEGECYLIYQTPSGDFTSFNVDAFVNRWAISQVPAADAFKFYVSPDDITYQEITPNVILGSEQSNFFNDKYTKKDLPEGSRYFKIKFMTNSAQAWAAHIGTVTLAHKALNRAPKGNPRFTMAMYENVATTTVIPVTDPDGDNLSYTVKVPPQHGIVAIEGSSVSFTPAEGYLGNDNFTIEAFDGIDGKIDQQVAVVVNHTPTNINYYVSSENGSDDNTGLTPENPFKTIQKAANLTCPGDIVNIMNGTYGESGKITLLISRSGTEDAYITYKAYSGNTPKIICIDTWDNILVEGADYIKIEGLKVEGKSDNITEADAIARYDHYLNNEAANTIDWGYLAATNANGIFIRDRRATEVLPVDYSHHVEIRNCEVYKFPGAGIGSDSSDYITIENNRVYSNAWWSVYANSGITLFHSLDWDSNTTAYKNVIRNNICYDNQSYIRWVATKNFSDGNGIIIDDNKHSQSNPNDAYKGRTLVENNVVYENGGGGINCYSSSNVDIVNNTAYNNSRSPELLYPQIFTGESDNCHVFNNVIYCRTGERPTSNNGSKNCAYDYNLYYNAETETQGVHDVTGDPLFVNISGSDLSAFDLSLKEGSPVIDMGTTELAASKDIVGNNRPLGSAIDIGAYEAEPVVTAPVISGSKPSPTPTPTPIPTPSITVEMDGSVKLNVKPILDNNTNTASAEVGKEPFDKMVEMAKKDSNGIKKISIVVEKVEGAKTYLQELPTGALTMKNADIKVEINTPAGTIVVPSNMFASEVLTGKSKVGLSIGIVDISTLSENAKNVIGSRPVIELNAKADGKLLEWSNPNAPVTVSVDYQPTVEELKDTEHIVVYYIDGKGKLIAVPNGKYDKVSGKVTFTTTHFSRYGLAYVKKSFIDITKYSWAVRPVEVLASKGIMEGTTDKTFEPKKAITRGEFISDLVKALGLTVDFDSNFSDVGKSSNYYEEIGIAKKLGITVGYNNKYNPDKEISRQDMMVLTNKALSIAGKKLPSGTQVDINNYADVTKVAKYAVEDVATLVKAGLILGSGKKLNPTSNATRAEAAVLLYKVYNK